MAEERAVDTPLQRDFQVSPDEYATFIRGLELAYIWVNDARIVNHSGPRLPRDVNVQGEESSEWQATPEGFRVLNRHTMRIRSDEILAGEVDVTFGLEYRSAVAMTDQLFATFSATSLALNSWPYLREFLSNATGRMYWTQFTLPTLKVGAGRPRPEGEEPPTAPTTAPKRRRRGAKSE